MSKHSNNQDSQEYLDKKRFFDQLLTIFGRKPVLEALQEKNSKIHRLHLAESNKKAKIPIIESVYNILYLKRSPKKTFKNLCEKIN